LRSLAQATRQAIRRRYDFEKFGDVAPTNTAPSIWSGQSRNPLYTSSKLQVCSISGSLGVAPALTKRNDRWLAHHTDL